MKITQPKINARNGKLYISFSLDGKQIRKSLNLDDNRKNRHFVETVKVPDLMYKINSGEFFKNADMQTVNEYSKVSFENHKHNRKYTTSIDYSNMYNKHIAPYFGEKKLDCIKPSDINRWKNKLYDDGNGLSSKRVNEIKKVFGTILQDALEDEIILSNPVRKSKPLPKHVRKEKDPFSLNEVKLILENSEGQDHNMFAVLFFTGMRTGEMIGLKWDDIDFERNTITIDRTIGRGIISKPKTTSSIRTIPILTPLLKPLKEQYIITGKYNSFVFLNNRLTHYFDSSKIRDRI